MVFLAILAVLAVFYTLFFARQVVLPVTIAMLLNFLFSPLVRWLKRKLRVPFSVSAAIVILSLLTLLGAAVYQLAAPAAEWVTKAPSSMHRIEDKLKKLRRPVDQMSRTADRVEEMTNLDGDNTTQVEVASGGLRAKIFGSTTSFLTGTALVATLLFFLLAGGDTFLAKTVKVLPRLRDKKLALTIAQETERSISVYLGATTVINLVLGILTGIAMYFIGLPNPLLWGLVGGLLNFVPYVGGLAAVIVLTLAGMATFRDTFHALLPGIAYFVLTNVESFVTPYVLGKRLTLNPVVVFIAVLFWGWLWGISGALLAVPIMATLKIICDHIKSLSTLGEFLGN
jgi:predicted PurR-regulated permease PerM